MTRGAAHAQVTKVVVTAGADVVAAGAHVVATASADARDPEDPKEAELNTAPLLSDEAFRGLHARVRALEETPDTATLHALAKRDRFQLVLWWWWCCTQERQVDYGWCRMPRARL